MTLEEFFRKVNNHIEPCPRCSYPMELVYKETFLDDGIVVRYACKRCGVVFNPNGSTERLISSVEAEAAEELRKAEIKIKVQDAIESARLQHEAEQILKRNK